MLEKEKRIRINAQKTLENIINKLWDIVNPEDGFTRKDEMYAETKYERVLFNYIYDRPITEGFKKELEELIEWVGWDGYTIHKRLVDETIDIVDCIAYVDDEKELTFYDLFLCEEPWNEDTGELAPEEFKGEIRITYPNAELKDENNAKRVREWRSELFACRNLNKK